MSKRFSMIIFWFLILSAGLKSGATGFPKWDGLVDLKEAGLPVPAGIFLFPYSDKFTIKKTVDAFTSSMGSKLIALRPDGVRGVGYTPPGINLARSEKKKIVRKLLEWSTTGYGVTLVETHNRFDYDFCCNVLLDDEGNFTIEFVGPGFDGGDLNKSILQPTMIVKNKPGSPLFIYGDLDSGEIDGDSLERLLFRVDIEDRNPSKKELEIRLNYMTNKLLPDMGIEVGQDIESTKRWLVENGCSRLLDGLNPISVVSTYDLKKIVSAVFSYCHSLLQRGESLKAKALTAHKYDGRVLFFGTYNGKKWGLV